MSPNEKDPKNEPKKKHNSNMQLNELNKLENYAQKIPLKVSGWLLEELEMIEYIWKLKCIFTYYYLI